MANYTNKGLVKHVTKALNDKTRYMWGGIYRAITDAYVNQLAKYYPEQYSSARQQKLKALPDGYYGIDCVGLIKSYYWSGNAQGGKGSPEYKGATDVNAHGMYNTAKVKGKIDSLPEIPGLIVYCKTYPHIGVYVGNGYVIESTLSSRGDGVVRTKLKDFKWEHWFQCPYITYEEELTASIKRVKLMYHAEARNEPRASSASCGRLVPGMFVTVVKGSETIDEATGYTYIKIKRNDAYQWIVKSALGKF